MERGPGAEGLVEESAERHCNLVVDRTSRRNHERQTGNE
jgi:hypothetical protein